MIERKMEMSDAAKLGLVNLVPLLGMMEYWSKCNARCFSHMIDLIHLQEAGIVLDRSYNERIEEIEKTENRNMKLVIGYNFFWVGEFVYKILDNLIIWENVFQK